MDTNERLSSYFQDYKANMEAAGIAEKRGNIDGAYKLYRQAALSLCEMANLESGETKRQRVMHAEQVMQKAEQLKAQPAVAVPAAAPAASNAPAAGKPGKSSNESKGIKENQDKKEDDENPWKSEGIPDTTFDDVIGMENVKELIRDTVIDQIKYPQLYEEYGLKGGTGVLLYGLPGTGKTTIARAIAHEINAPLYTVLLSDVLNKWVGESERLIKQLFDKARESETVLIFFDDFDSLGAKRQDDGNYQNKIIVELINQMDGFRKNTNTMVLLAATNKPWLIDSALMRPGRFEHHIYVPLADHEARIAMVKKMLGNVPLADDIDMNRVSDMLKGYNGADINSVVKTVKTAALQRAKDAIERGLDSRSAVTMEDFEAAADSHKTSVDPGDIVQLRKYAESRGLELPEEL